LNPKTVRLLILLKNWGLLSLKELDEALEISENNEEKEDETIL
jgi:hypothetical protein